MYYSIGEIADTAGIATSTLRYYDREGMFPDMKRSRGGIRVFSDRELNTVRVIECLKKAGMPIREIKEFLVWCSQGDSSLSKRQEMFHSRLKDVEKQMEELQNTINTLKFKCWYYDKAAEAGTEDVVKDLKSEDIPEELRDYRI